MWGVATSAYQIEGGLNGPGEPRNNWAAWEARGRAEVTGGACGFWQRWAEDLDRAATLGVTAFRMGIEWARLEPRGDGGLDPVAVDRYADIIAGARARGMAVVLTLQHFTHPEWLGSDPWLDPEVPARFAGFARDAATALGRALNERHGQPPPSFYVTVNEPNSLCLATYMLRAFPSARRGSRKHDTSRAMAGIAMAHVRAYRALHAAYDREGWPAPTVTYNAWACAAYAADRLLVDLLRPHSRHEIAARRRRFRRALNPRALRERLIDRVVGGRIALRAFDPLVAELGPEEDPLDVLALDYYDPYLADYVGWTGLRVHPWTWRARPERLARFLGAYVDGHEDKALYILENGVGLRASPDRRGRHRPDGLTRSQAIEDALAGVDEALQAGVPLKGYFHWSLTDNYEWGSWTPRFGLFGVDLADGARRLTTDIAGDDAAGTYRQAIAARMRHDRGDRK